MNCKWSLQLEKPTTRPVANHPFFHSDVPNLFFCLLCIPLPLEWSNYKLHCNFMFVVSIFATFSFNLKVLLYFIFIFFIGHDHINGTINPFVLGNTLFHLQKILYCVFYMLHIWKVRYECILCNNFKFSNNIRHLQF
jgi:hypothetical protein